MIGFVRVTFVIIVIVDLVQAEFFLKCTSSHKKPLHSSWFKVSSIAYIWLTVVYIIYAFIKYKAFTPLMLEKGKLIYLGFVLH